MPSGQIWDQTKTLLKKDLLLHGRRWPFTLMVLCCPILMLMLSTVALFIIDEDVVVRPFETMENRLSPISSSYVFDPFPLDCSEVAPPREPGGEYDWRQEPLTPLEQHTEFDCFIDAMASMVPFWRNLVAQLRQMLAWTPAVQTFAIIPGKTGDETTLGGRLEKYMYNRYDEKTYVSRELYKVIHNDCFNKLTASAVNSVHSAFPATTAAADVFEQCITTYPAECLSACNTGAHLNLANGTLPTSVAGEFPAKLMTIATTQASFARRMTEEENEESSPRALMEHIERGDGKNDELGEIFFKDPIKRENSDSKISESYSANGALELGLTEDEKQSYYNPLVHDLLKHYNKHAKKHDRRQVRVLSAFQRPAPKNAAETQELLEKESHGEYTDKYDPDLRHGEARHGMSVMFPPFFRKMAEKTVHFPLTDIDDSQMIRGEFVKGGDDWKGRVLQKGGGSSASECEKATEACDCAKLAPACGWQKRPRGGGRCRPSQSGARRFETSCYECDTQIRDGTEVCKTTEIWTRMGIALESLKPYIRVFESEEKMEEMIEDRGYPKTATVSVDGGASIRVPQSICGAVAFQDAPSSLASARTRNQLKFSVRTNGTDSLNLGYGYTTRQTVVARASTRWALTYTRSSFVGLQGMVNEFLQCSDDDKHCFNSPKYSIPKSNYVDIQKVSAGWLGIPAHWENPKLQAVMSTENDISGSLFFAFCVPVFLLCGQMLREKENKIAEGMFMMGLQKRAWYLATFISMCSCAFVMGLMITLIWFWLPDFTRASSFFLMFFYHWMLFANIFMFGTSLTAYFQQETLGKIAIFGCCLLSNLFTLIVEEMEDGWLGLAPNNRIHLRRFFGLFAGVNIKWAYGVFSELEFKLDGVTFSSMGERIISGPTNFSFADAILTQMLGVILFTMIWMYLDQVGNSGFGVYFSKMIQKIIQ